MLVDLVLTIAHHVLVFLVAAAFAAEAVILRLELSRASVRLLSRIDALYGALAGLVILVGIGRVFFGLRGWEFYVYNWAFWAKMATFVAVGLLSIAPTLQIRKWLKAAGDETFTAPAAEIARVRGLVRAQSLLFLLVAVFAATMVRYGY
jgi:putative membrane protein